MDSFSIDNLLDSMVKIVGPDEENIEGSGFIIRSDGYLITCHHVVYPLSDLKVSYRENIYRAKWCEELSDIETDIAVLKIDIQDAVPVTIVNPEDLSGEVVVVGFPHSKSVNFPHGFDFHSKNIQPSTPINTLSTYNSLNEIKYFNPWNKLPLKKSTFRSFRIDAEIHPGASGGPVFIEGLGGVVGLIQSCKANSGHVIRWDNILDKLDALNLNLKRNTNPSMETDYRSSENNGAIEKAESYMAHDTNGRRKKGSLSRWLGASALILGLLLVLYILFSVSIMKHMGLSEPEWTKITDSVKGKLYETQAKHSEFEFSWDFLNFGLTDVYVAVFGSDSLYYPMHDFDDPWKSKVEKRKFPLKKGEVEYEDVQFVIFALPRGTKIFNPHRMGEPYSRKNFEDILKKHVGGVARISPFHLVK